MLSYYGEQDGAPVAARYSVRYAEVRTSSSSSTEIITQLDGTASTPQTECLDLGTGERSLLTIFEAQQTADWHLCFRRESISLNGGSGGPRGATAVDLDAESTEAEQIADIRLRTAETEQDRFDQVDNVRLLDPNLVFQPDAVVSAFAGRWLAEDSDPPRPSPAVWFVLGWMAFPDSAGAMFVLDTPEVTDDPDDYRPVRELRVLPGADRALCGNDLVLLRLAEPLPSPPLVLRIDRAPTVGEPYSAFGYG